MDRRTYIAIDLKSFYASVECMARGLDPMDTHLVVADISRTEKTICLAVSPALKAYGIPGRCRLFEAMEKKDAVNRERMMKAPGKRLIGTSASRSELQSDPTLALDFIIAPPHMAAYITKSSEIYSIYLGFVAPEDIHVYSIDEVFIDATPYLSAYRLSARELAQRMILSVMERTGITATAGIGENLYLAKVAMDIMAKHTAADEHGVRIAELDEMSYRRKLWTHRPLTDFWRVGHGYARKLEERRIFTMGDVARCSVEDEDMLYRLFGVNAELLIDHAWGWEPCTMEDIKAYRPEDSSIGQGQVLQCAYSCSKAILVLKEMADSLALDLVRKALVTDQIVLSIGYDKESLNDGFSGETKVDRYGRTVPKGAHGSVNLKEYTSSSRTIIDASVSLFRRNVTPSLLIRRLYLTASHTVGEWSEEARAATHDLFEASEEDESAARERKLQEAALSIKKRFGKNAILRGTSYEDGATARERNGMIGGHKA